MTAPFKVGDQVELSREGYADIPLNSPEAVEAAKCLVVTSIVNINAQRGHAIWAVDVDRPEINLFNLCSQHLQPRSKRPTAARCIVIDKCNLCPFSDHKGAFGAVACIPVCRRANRELPYTVHVDRGPRATPTNEIPDWCPLTVFPQGDSDHA